MRVDNRVCPRCSGSGPGRARGWLFRDGPVLHCLMCGCILEDNTRRGGHRSTFKNLLAHNESKLLFDTVDCDELARLLGLEMPVQPSEEVNDDEIGI